MFYDVMDGEVFDIWEVYYKVVFCLNLIIEKVVEGLKDLNFIVGDEG